MDWYLQNDHAAGAALREELRGYLDRHAEPGSDVSGAELAFSELLTNAVEHTDNDVWVSLDWGGVNPVVTIHDLGAGFSIDHLVSPDVLSPRGRGLMVASHLTSAMTVAAKRAGGSRVSAVLAVTRSASADHDYPPTSGTQLPAPSEADDGYFGRESFLRALVVELADAVELSQGPSVAEAAIAQVGANVGGSMETAYRAREGRDEPMGVAELADFYVALKAAIGGDFFVIEADERRVVLGNRRCPFGDVVRRAPSLCRMTSSVFGGIAARNSGREVAVHLEERIAVGDPECRVTVWLDPPPPEVEVFVHRYRNRSATG